MNKKEIIFITNGNENIGMGHISRCTSIASKLKKYYDVRFFSIYSNKTLDIFEKNNIQYVFFDSIDKLIYGIQKQANKIIIITD